MTDRREEELEQLYVQYEQQIRALIYRMMHDEDDANDLTQDTFVKAYNGFATLPPDTNYAGWLYQIARDNCMDQLRRRHRRLPQGDQPVRWYRVPQVLDRMSPQNREALLLREYQGMGLDEIGKHFGISLSETKTLLFNAREEFRAIAKAMERDPNRGMQVPSSRPINLHGGIGYLVVAGFRNHCKTICRGARRCALAGGYDADVQHRGAANGRHAVRPYTKTVTDIPVL